MRYHLSDMLILEQVSESPKKPYRIIKGIVGKFDIEYKPSTGMIYPAIDRLLKAGYIKKTMDGYIITEEGKKYRSNNRENYEKLISNFMDNKLFFRNLRKAVRDLISTIKESDKSYIRENQETIIEEIGEISRKIKNKE
ncbi:MULTISPECIES: PadR family transcriptional regulator [Ferroplasma]|jgi:DNA-binding PadR family transcriptional regulator|uniref:Transcriptional regulator n=2 Tax=Ferroplasma TaxID=74968 RepID=S0ANP9_FERAC|nr:MULTISPECIES: PadR family transcriptional regulator [Ferroplasma]AGO60893.1 transcriptional regulator [Ferroplasma acidarmanus Fer1]MCL4349476.1 PadR family transcriptional regulator [Candidatus Thermoplasmatota archaeon]NOL60690.1 PadR family transcriptional regulator [Ferroplasma acidiphilum]WMT52773.1 MAG: PadR family transcriptional regulator [Ferroplasma acidiphilum]